MADVSKLELNGEMFDIKDQVARQTNTELTNSLAGVRSEVAALTAAVGHPATVDDATAFGATGDDALDTTQLYVFMGAEETTIDETTFTPEHWYYYNDGWVDGGEWGSAVAIDDTLSISGAAADAKAAGDAITIMSNNFLAENFILGTPTTDYFTLEQGAVASATGANNVATSWLDKRRRSGIKKVTAGSIISCPDTSILIVYFFTSSNWQSFTGMFSTETNTYMVKNTDNPYMRLMVKPAEGTTYADEDMPIITYTPAVSRISQLESKTQSVPTIESIVEPTRNLINVPISACYANASGEIVNAATTNIRKGMTAYIPCEASTYYTFTAYDTGCTTKPTFYIAWKDANGDFIQRDNANRAATNNRYYWKKESPANAAYMNFSIYNADYLSEANTKLQIEVGRASTSYIAPYTAQDLVARELADANEEAVLSLTGGNYPDYFQDSLDTAVSNVYKNMAEVGMDGESFVFFTDPHWSVNQKHSPSLIHYMIAHTNVRNVVCGGDLMSGNADDTERAKVKKFMNAMSFCPGGLKFVAGNHDYSHSYHDFESPEVYSMFYAQAEMEWQDVHTLLDRIFCYFDVPATNTRYLNIGMPYGMLRAAEIPWVEEQIVNNQDKNIIIFAHYLYKEKIENDIPPHFVAEAQSLMRLCSAYNNVKAIIYGHIHADKVDYTPSGIPLIAVDTDGAANLSSTLNPYASQDLVGTPDEQAFDVMTVNHTDCTVKCARVGRGKNRVVHGGTTIVPVLGNTTLTADLEDAVWSSSNIAIGTVDDGLVSGLTTGMTVICAENDTDAEYWSITVGTSTGTIQLAVGDAVSVPAPVLLTTITNGSWTSMDPTIATVEDGVVRGVKAGKTAVRAKGKQNDVANMYEYWDVVVS